MMTVFVRMVDRVALVGGWLAAALVLLITVHILVEICLRSIFTTSTFVLDEFVGYAVAAATFLGAGYTLREDGFIRVGLLLQAVSSRESWRRALELVCVVLGLVASNGLLWYFARSAWRHFERGTVSETVSRMPMWVPEGAVVIGLGILALSLIACLVEVVGGGPLIYERKVGGIRKVKAQVLRER